MTEPRSLGPRAYATPAPRNTVGLPSSNASDLGLARLNIPYRLYSGPGITATYAGTGVALMLDLTTVEPGDTVIAEDRWVPVWDESSKETRKLPMLGSGTVLPHVHPESDVINLIPDLAKKLEDAPLDGLSYARASGQWQSIVTKTISWDDVLGKPTTFPPTLPIPQSGITNLESDLSAIQSKNTEQDGRLTAVEGVNTTQNAAILLKEDKAAKGQTNGYASLDGGGKVPAAQLPSYVDDIVEYANLAAFPATGETGKIYVALDTNKLYRWTGSAYVEVSAGNIDVYTRGESDARYVDVAGDTMTGPLVLNANPTAPLGAATKQMVDAKVGPDAPSDGFQYARKNAAWEKVTGGAIISDTPPASPLPASFWWESDSGGLFIRYDDGNSAQWVMVNSPSIPDAASDGKAYGRLSGAWSEVLPITGGTLTGNLIAPIVRGDTGLQSGGSLVFTNIANFQVGYAGAANVTSGTSLFEVMFAGTASYRFSPSAGLRPVTDNAMVLGASSQRWSTVYAGTGTINTSDEREKQDIRPLDDAEKRVAQALKGLIVAYRWKDAVQAKGADGARIHVGVIAQRVAEAFEAEGLDPAQYGLWCADALTTHVPPVLGDDGSLIEEAREEPTGEIRYGVRYDELLAFIIGGL